MVDTSPNVLELDFDAVPTEGNDVLSELNAYFSSRTPTNKNEKTGMSRVQPHPHYGGELFVPRHRPGADADAL